MVLRRKEILLHVSTPRHRTRLAPGLVSLAHHRISTLTGNIWPGSRPDWPVAPPPGVDTSFRCCAATARCVVCAPSCHVDVRWSVSGSGLSSWTSRTPGSSWAARTSRSPEVFRCARSTCKQKIGRLYIHVPFTNKILNMRPTSPTLEQNSIDENLK